MDDYRWTEFGNLYSEPSRNGLTKPKKVRGQGHKFINMGEIFQYDRLRRPKCDRAPLTETEKKTSLLKSNDLLFARQSLVLSGAGKCSIFLSDREEISFDSHIIRIRINREVADPLFYYYLFRSKLGRSLIESIVEQGAGASGIRGSDLQSLHVPCPPIFVQRQIADLLGSLDDKIELNRRMNETLEALARAIFKDWFVDFGPTRAKAEGRVPYLATELWDLFPDAVDDEDKPFGWMLHPASDLFEFNPRESVKKGMNAPYLDMAALPTLGAVADIPIHREYKSGSKFRDGDTLFARITPCLENGKTAYVFDLGKGVVGGGSTEFIVIRSRASLPKPVSYILARDPEFRAHAERSMTGTSGRQRANYEALSRYELAGPVDDRLWRALGDVVNPLMDRVIANARETRTLAQTRDFLLPKLMSGEIRLREAVKVVEAAA